MSFAEPEGSMQKFRATHDRRCLQEIKLAAGRKCFIADLKNARQCGYTRDQRVYRVGSPSHSAITEVSRTLSSLGRHRAPVVRIPMNVGDWIQPGLVEEYCSRPAWFLIEVTRSNVKARFQLLSSCDADWDPDDESTLCKVTQGFSMDWLRHERCYLRVGDAVPWDNIQSLVHITTAESAAGILKVGLIRTMGSGGGRAATMFSPVSQTDRRAVGGMLYEGEVLDHEIHVDVAEYHLRGEEIWCSMSGSLNVIDDVHFTEIAYTVQLFAGQKVTVYDRNLHKAFPTNATDIRADAWELRRGSGATSGAPSAECGSVPA